MKCFGHHGNCVSPQNKRALNLGSGGRLKCRQQLFVAKLQSYWFCHSRSGCVGLHDSCVTFSNVTAKVQRGAIKYRMMSGSLLQFIFHPLGAMWCWITMTYLHKGSFLTFLICSVVRVCPCVLLSSNNSSPKCEFFPSGLTWTAQCCPHWFPMVLLHFVAEATDKQQSLN